MADNANNANNTAKITKLPPKLPAKIAEWQRKLKSQPSLNDIVEQCHTELWDESEAYRDFLEAVYDEQAVEGSLGADNIMAAQVIREHAKSNGYPLIAKQKLATISKSLGVVLRRYDYSRKDRRQRVGDEIVPDNSSGE